MGTHYQGPASEVAALDAFIKLTRAADSVAVRAHAVLPEDLTVGHFGVLEALYHRGPMCPSVLAGKVLRSPGNLTLVLSNLYKAGYIRRERSAEDRRFVTIHLTAKGRTCIAGLFPKIAAAITREFAALTPAEQCMLGELCRKLGVGRAAAG